MNKGETLCNKQFKELEISGFCIFNNFTKKYNKDNQK